MERIGSARSDGTPCDCSCSCVRSWGWTSLHVKPSSARGTSVTASSHGHGQRRTVRVLEVPRRAERVGHLPAALEPFLRLGFDLLREAARVNPRALAAGDGLREGAPFAFGAESLRKPATPCDRADAAARAIAAATAQRPAADLVGAAGAIS